MTTTTTTVITKEALSNLLNSKHVNQLAISLDNGITSVDEILKYTQDQWSLIVGPERIHIAFDIYNHLHPPSPAVPEIGPLEYVKQIMPAPSSFIKARERYGWVQILSSKKVGPNIVCHRMPDEIIDFPVHLYTEVFGQFLHDVETIMDVSSKDIAHVYELVNTMSGNFRDEGLREAAFHDWFKRFTSIQLRKISGEGYITDGTCFNDSDHYMIVNLEVKNEKGDGGGDPYMQNIAYYVKALPNDLTLQYPCFLVELFGTILAISGMVNTQTQLICDNFTIDYLVRDLNFNRILGLTRKLVAFRNALNTLKTTKQLHPASLFPYTTSFRRLSDNQIVQLQYLRKLRSMVCVALMDGVEVIVKFTQHYGRDVHEFCALNGFAPQLYAVELIKPDFYMVVMEKIKGHEIRNSTRNHSEFKEQLSQILTVMHGSGFVHGDFRSNNIILEEGTGRLVVVDFDWSGRVEHCTYPVVLNTVDLKWPQGADIFKPILPEHDWWWARAFAG